MIMNHLDIVHSYHLQKNLGGLAQKWASYGDFRAATRIFLKNAFRPDQPSGWNFELGLTAPIFGRSAQFFLLASYTSQLFGWINFGALQAPQAENLGGGAESAPPRPK